MEQALKEFNEALYALRDKVNEVHTTSLEAREKMANVVEGSHLKSVFSLMKEDIGFRRLLDLNHY